MAAMLPYSSDDFLIIGHRGAAGLAPENTLAGFAKAVALAVDAVELDVQMAAGEVVVIHDQRVDRTTDGAGLVAELSFAALRRLDAGDGQVVPTLNEVLDAVPEQVMVNIELKGAGTAAPVAQIVESRERPLLISSFDHAELVRFHQLLPDVPCAPLAGRWRAGLEAIAGTVEAWAVNLADRAATPDRVAAVRSWGCRCLVYTVNEPGRVGQLRSMGAGGVFTDYPNRVPPLARRCRSPTA